MTMIRSTHIRLLVLFAMVAVGVVLVAGQQPQPPAGGRGGAPCRKRRRASRAWRTGGACQPHGHHRRRRGQELRAGHRRDAPQSDPSDWLIVQDYTIAEPKTKENVGLIYDEPHRTGHYVHVP